MTSVTLTIVVSQIHSIIPNLSDSFEIGDTIAAFVSYTLVLSSPFLPFNADALVLPLFLSVLLSLHREPLPLPA